MLNYPRIAAEIARHQWAITTEALEGIKLAVTVGLQAEDRERFHAASEEDYKALLFELGDLLDDDTRYARKKGKVGSLFIGGPIVPRASDLLQSSGMVSLDKLSSELNILAEDESVETILLVFDSPGGVVTGVSEFASLLAGCDKRTFAYAYGAMASAAYWIGSAADAIWASDTSLVGSVGVLREVSSSEDRLVIRNAQSPKKGLSADSDEGRKDVERILTGLADVFIDTVAKNRKVDRETVIKDFGQGSVLVASEALAVGAVDGIGTLYDTMASLQDSGDSMSDKLIIGGVDYSRLDRSFTTASIPPLTTVASEPQEEIEIMPTLHELIAGDVGLRAEVEAMKEAAREEGAASERAVREAEAAKQKEKLNAKAIEILESEAYAKLRPMALRALKGELKLEALEGAQAAFDAVSAAVVEDSAVADSGEIPAIVMVEPVASATDERVLASEEDVEAEISEFRGV